MFKPRYIKEGELLAKGVKRFVNYRRDILKPKALEEIEALRQRHLEAIQKRDPQAVKDLGAQLSKVCEGAAPNYRASAIADNVEVIFVAFAIALGIRAYVAQPFKIPTGSMQPTLNGIIVTKTQDEPPNHIVRAIDVAWKGRSWVNVVAKDDERIETIESWNLFHFLNFTRIKTTANNSYLIPAPPGNVEGGGEGSFNLREGDPFHKGQVIARGYVDTGDQVIVDKFSYHFIPPRRGEVFVFTTNNIELNNPYVPRDEHGEPITQHYIKRTAGLPGDELSIQDGKLYINGEVPQEFGFQRVMKKENGYRGYFSESYWSTPEEMSPSRMEESKLAPRKIQDVGVRLPKEGESPYGDRYAALGDNSGNSADSRAWGSVPEKNLVGRAFCVYWPFTSHWGMIR